MSENTRRITAINKEGVPFLTIYIIAAILLNVFLFMKPIFGWWSVAVLTITVFLFIILLNFYRNPRRIFPSHDRENVVVAPADGRIVAIEEVDETDYFHDRRIVVSTFMSIFSVHANWFPVNGVVTKVEHQQGSFHAAYKPKSSTENERSLVIIRTDRGQEIMVRQIAGACARRIVTYPSVGQRSKIDRHLGFIKLGSRVDVYLPKETLICVKLGQKVKANTDFLAKLP